MSEIFEKAARLKLRWDSPMGQLSVEELWDLPLTSTTKKANLDDMAITLDRELKETTTTSFVKKTTKSNEIAKLKFDIVFRIIEARQADNEASEIRKANAERKQQILALIADKQNETLKGKSIEELQVLVNQL